MPSQRGHVDHSHLKRKLYVKKSLEAHEPGLIPSPSPIASSVLGPSGIGPNPPPPSPIPPPGGGGGGNGGGGGHNNNGGGGGNGEDGGGDGNGGGNGGGGGGNGNGGDGGGGPGNGNGGGNGSGGNNSNGGGDDNGGGVGASNPGDGGGATNNPSSTLAQAPSPVPGTGTTELTNGATSASVSHFWAANVGTRLTHAASGATSSSYIAFATASSSTGLSSLSPSQSGIINNMGDDSGSNTGSTKSNTGALEQNHGLSPGGIAGIVTFLLVVGLVGLILVLRRRAIAGRIARRRWFARGVGAGLYADYDNPKNSATATSRKSGSPPDSRSARSSFATTFDQSHSLKFGFDFDAFLPPIPPMAEIRGEEPLIMTAAPSNLAPKNQRKSSGSNSSNSIDPNAQDLLLTPGIQSDNVIGAPMSVRPFSPSESYSFPRPPPSREGISTLYNSHGEGADKVWSLINASQKSPAAEGPFADPVPAATAMQPDFADIKMIQRPFVPTLPDELAVAVGDRVRIVQTFDDGWAFVQKLPTANNKKGKAKVVDEFDQGLIPIDCLRNANQDSVQKQINSYVEDAEVVSGIAC